MTFARLFDKRIPIAAIFLLCLAGCGDGSPATWPVSGKVLFPDGTPLGGGRIEFEAVDHKPPVTASGTIQPDGSFVLGTFAEQDGAVPGRHRVAIFPSTGPHPENKHYERPEYFEESQIPDRYQNFRKSGIEKTVREESNVFDIVIDQSDSD